MRPLKYINSVWRNQRRQTSLPRFLTYTVTFTCNARCIMCDSWKKPSPFDLELHEIERIFNQLPTMDGVRLTGGEPFVRKDLPQIVRLVESKLKPLFIHITSNGFLTDRIVDFCNTRHRKTPLHLMISIDGTKDKHNQVRGTRKAWDYAMGTLHALAPRQKELGLHLSVNQTIVDAAGVDEYKRLRDILQPLNVRNHMVMAYDASATYSLDEETDVAPTQIGEFTTFGHFSKAELRHLLDEVAADLPQFPFWERLAKRYYLRGIRNRLLNDQGSPNPKCTALNSHLRIFPNGQVPTCQFNTKTTGNLRHQSFAELWHSDTTQQQREWVYKCPGCWAECEILPNAIYGGDLIKHALTPSRGGKRHDYQKPIEV